MLELGTSACWLNDQKTLLEVRIVAPEFEPVDSPNLQDYFYSNRILKRVKVEFHYFDLKKKLRSKKTVKGVDKNPTTVKMTANDLGWVESMYVPLALETDVDGLEDGEPPEYTVQKPVKKKVTTPTEPVKKVTTKKKPKRKKRVVIVDDNGLDAFL